MIKYSAKQPLFCSLCGILCCSILACIPKTTPQAGPTETIDANSEAGQGHVERFDVNHDRKADIWKYFESANGTEYLARKEMDLNSDGRVDIIRHYNADGIIQKEILDMDFDGRIDCVNVFKDGQLSHKDMDLNYDGKNDVWKYYEHDKVIRIEMDKNHDGQVDYWEYYENEQLDHVGYDTDNDGKPDRVERRKLAEEPTTSETVEEAQATTENDDDDDED